MTTRSMGKSIAAPTPAAYNPAVRLRVLLPAFVLLASCTVPTAAPIIEEERDTSSSPIVIESGTGELDITPEPFAEPLEPLSLTGSVSVEERTLSGGVLEIGHARAGLVMDVFVNVESPYAREFQRSRLPAVIGEFVEKGLARIRFHILPIEKYAGSAESARAIACAAGQGKGYPVLDLLFREERTTPIQEDVTELELDAVLYLSCVQTQRNDPLAPARAAAAKHGVTLVPAYVIDGEVFVGLPSEADLLGAVRSAL